MASPHRARPLSRARASLALLSAASLAALLACGGGEGTGEPSGAGGSAAAASAAEEGSSHTHENGEEHTHEGGGTHTHAAADTLAHGASLDPGSGAGWSGSVTVLARGDSLRVLVSVRGADAGSRLGGELVAGDCGAPGPVLAELVPVAAGSSGAGSSQTTVPGSAVAGHDHGAVRLASPDGSRTACAPIHLAGGHEHDDG